MSSTRSIGEVGSDTLEGGLKGGFYGFAVGALCVVGAAFTGGATLDTCYIRRSRCRS